MCPVKRSHRAIMALGFVLCFLFSQCGVKQPKVEEEEITVSIHSKDLTDGLTLKADSILSGMTLEERVGQCLMPSIPSSSETHNVQTLQKWIQDYHIGGVVLHKGDLTSAKLLSEIGEDARIPLLVGIDAEWGLGMRLEDAPKYPKNGNITKESGEVALFDYGQQIARECKEIGINLVLGPVIDVTSRRTGIIGTRSFGGDPELVSAFGIAYAKGVESGGIISVAKHFPGHGGANQDSHYETAKLNRSLSALDTIDLTPFRNYISSGLSGIMAGHIQIPAIDPERKPASVSYFILTDLLQGEMGFQGLVLTDAFDMGGIKEYRASDALRAGADIILCPKDIAEEYKNLLNEVKKETLDLRIINDRCRKILFYKLIFAIM